MPVDPHEILLAEDDAEEAELALSAFSEAGFEARCYWVKDGVEALDYVRAGGDYASRSGLPPPALLLVDIRMPRMTGIELLRELKGQEATRCIPVVMLTTSRERKDIDACYALGVNSYVVKPVKYEKFRETLRQIALYWTEVNVPRWLEQK